MQTNERLLKFTSNRRTSLYRTSLRRIFTAIEHRVQFPAWGLGKIIFTRVRLEILFIGEKYNFLVLYGIAETNKKLTGPGNCRWRRWKGLRGGTHDKFHFQSTQKLPEDRNYVYGLASLSFLFYKEKNTRKGKEKMSETSLNVKCYLKGVPFCVTRER